MSAASAGANIGYRVIWLIALSTILMLVYVDMAVRIGLSYPGSSIEGIKETVGRPLGVATGCAVFCVAFIFMVGNVLGSALGLSLLFGGSVPMWSGIVVAVVLAMLWARRFYSILEWVALVLVGCMVVAFAVTAVLSQPDWGAVGRGFVPGPFGGDAILALALLGTNLSMYASFYMTYTIREKQTTREQYRDTTLTDTLAGVIAPGIMTILIVVAGASVIKSGATVSSGEDIANILRPVLGGAAVAVFAIGLFAAGFTSVTGGVAAGGTTMADGLSWGNRLDTWKVKILGTAGLLVSLVLSIVFGGLPVQLIIFVNALTLFIFPFLATMMMVLANNRRRMGSLANSIWQNVLGAIGWAIVVAGAVTLGISLVNG